MQHTEKTVHGEEWVWQGPRHDSVSPGCLARTLSCRPDKVSGPRKGVGEEEMERGGVGYGGIEEHVLAAAAAPSPPHC